MKNALVILVLGLMFTFAFPYIQGIAEGAGDETMTGLGYTKAATSEWDVQTTFIQGLFGLLTIVLAVLSAIGDMDRRSYGR